LAYWIFQANPKEFHFLDALAAHAIRSWHVKQHAREIRAGDAAFLWKAGADSGIYARASLTSDPRPQPPSDQQLAHYAPKFHDALLHPSHLRSSLAVQMTFTRPILRAELRLHPSLANLSILRMPRGTNFAVTEAEGRLLDELAWQRRVAVV
jgi:predicted RNA-binding protein with PUA-like domain